MNLEIKAIYLKNEFFNLITVGEEDCISIQRTFSNDCPLGHGYLVTWNKEGKYPRWYPDNVIKSVILSEVS